MSDRFDRVRSFMCSHARLLERLLFAVRFDGAKPAAVGQLISAYQNPDGGLGHALEPDVRCPESQPLFVEVGLSALCDVSWREPRLALSVCDFLESVSDPAGLVPILLPSALRWPRAAHWRQTGEPALNPTAGICGLLHYQAVEHPWLARATRTCCELLLQNPPREAHGLLTAAHLVEYLPDARLADLIAEQIASALPGAAFYIPNAPVQGYGLTPLHFSPAPTSRWRGLFTADQIAGHLAHLLALQQPDGGWPISWEAPGPASTSEWRGRWTLEAVSTLAAYGYLTE